MECRDCATSIDPEWTHCEVCGAPVDSESTPISGGRKWAARLLRFFGTMVVVAAVIVGRLGPVGVFGVATGVGINYAGRRLNPQAGAVTVAGVLGGLLGLLLPAIFVLAVFLWILSQF
jgi:hypothetical protein